MQLSVALGVYAGVFVAAFLVLFAMFGYTFFSAILLALIGGLIFLNIAFPVTRDELDDVNSLTVLYSFIQIFTIVVLIIYALLRLLPDKRSKPKFPFVEN